MVDGSTAWEPYRSCSAHRGDEHGCWWAQLFVELCIVIMFLGSIIGGIVQCGQIFLSAADLYQTTLPDWLNWRCAGCALGWLLQCIPCCMEGCCCAAATSADTRLTT